MTKRVGDVWALGVVGREVLHFTWAVGLLGLTLFGWAVVLP